MLCVFDIPDLWDPEGSGIAKLESISKRLREVSGVKEVMDLARLNASLSLLQPKGLFGSFGVAVAESSKIPLFDRENQLAKEMLGLFEGYTHLSDSKTTAILCMLEPTLSTKEQAFAIDGIQRIVREPILNDASIQGSAIGEPILVHDGFRMVEADGKGLGVAATIILSLLLLIGFRSIRWAIIAIVVVQWSLVVTEGCIVWCDMHLTMVSSMLSALVTVIGVATTIHWMMSYQIEYERTGDARIAIESSLRQRIIPIVFACVTDAIGFGSLMVARVGPVRDYGLMMSLASMVVLVGILTWIPALATLGSRGFGLRQIPGDPWIRFFLSWSLAMLRRHPRAVSLLTILVVIWGVVGATRMKVETDFIQNFRSDWPMVKAYDRVEKNLGGAGVWDVLLPAPKVMNDSYLNSVRALEGELRDLRTGNGYRLSKVLSLADAEYAARAARGSQLLPTSARLALMQATMPGFFSAMYASPRPEEPCGWLRVMVRSPERADAEHKLEMIQKVHAKVEAWAVKEVANWKEQASEGKAEDTITPRAGTPRSEDLSDRSDLLRPKVTGHFVLLTRLIDSLIADQWRCFAVASLGIGALLWIIIGNLRWVLIAMIPNSLPAMIVLGAMGWLGWKLNLGAALIAAVSIGLSVDSSLHYLLQLRNELDEGGTLAEGLERCQREVGMAMLVSTFALMLGFSWLMTSDFLPTVVFGATSVLTMLGGLIGNLWLMPTMIGYFTPSVNNEGLPVQQKERME